MLEEPLKSNLKGNNAHIDGPEKLKKQKVIEKREFMCNKPQSHRQHQEYEKIEENLTRNAYIKSKRKPVQLEYIP